MKYLTKVNRTRPKPELYHFSKNREMCGRIDVIQECQGRGGKYCFIKARIYDNRTGYRGTELIAKQFDTKEVRQANEWMYQQLDCPLFVLLSSKNVK